MLKLLFLLQKMFFLVEVAKKRYLLPETWLEKENGEIRAMVPDGQYLESALKGEVPEDMTEWDCSVCNIIMRFHTFEDGLEYLLNMPTAPQDASDTQITKRLDLIIGNYELVTIETIIYFKNGMPS